MNGVFLACGQGHGVSIGLEEQEEDQDAVDEADDHAQHPSEQDHLEVVEDCVPENDLEPANTNLESSEDEKDLIDRQLESGCLEICADHHQAVLHEEKEKLLSKCGDTWENVENGESPCSTRASSLDTFAKEHFEVAEACAPVPEMAHVGDWELYLGPRLLLISAGLPHLGERERKRVRKTGHVGREKGDRGLIIIDSVNLSDD